MMSVLSVESVTVEYKVAGGVVHALEDASFSIDEAQIVGLVGESGCGKSTLGKTILRLLPDNGSVQSGRIMFQGQDLFQLNNAQFRSQRWRHLAYIPQNALSSLDPVYRVGAQIVEAIRAHERTTRKDAMDRARQLFAAIHLDERSLHAYSHQLSGGMRQRALIAMAVALSPALVIIDEPTTALDVVTQAQVLKEFLRIRDQTSSSILYITHDLGVIRQLCDRVIVMYAGRVIESGPVEDIFARALHPYTMGLVNAVPRGRGAAQLVSIAGAPPNLRTKPQGCAFAPRCPFAEERCTTHMPELKEASAGRQVACHLSERAEELRAVAERPDTWNPPSAIAGYRT